MVQHDDRDDTELACFDCGADIGPDDDWVYESAGILLCWTCALRRGGVFDADHDRWVVSPDVAQLPDERRAHA